MASVVIVLGLGYGDEGKGTIVDYLVRRHRSNLVVRYNGAGQAAHNVVLNDGRHHTFSQFGAGTFVPGCRTLLSRHMIVSPLTLGMEERALRRCGVTDAYTRLFIEKGALITNPFQIASNRLKEMHRNKGRHGSTGMGVGETVADFVANGEAATIRVRDLEDLSTLRDKLAFSQKYKMNQLRPIYEQLEKTRAVEREWDMLSAEGAPDRTVARMARVAQRVQLVDEDFLAGALGEDEVVIFEGAQGVLLDQDFGTFPFVTRSRITFENAFELLKGFEGDVRRLGLVRSYMTRHGAGPFVTEDQTVKHPELHNTFSEWQEGWRQGHFDLVALDYAIRAVGGVDEMVVTHMDRFQGPQKACTAYDKPWPLPVATDEPTRLKELERATQALFQTTPRYEMVETAEELLSRVEAVAHAPVTIVSSGPTAEDKHERSKARRGHQASRSEENHSGISLGRGGSQPVVSLCS